MNRKGVIPPKAAEDNQQHAEQPIGYTDGVGEESLRRFDEKKQKRQRSSRNRGHNRNRDRSGDRQEGNDAEHRSPKRAENNE